MTRRTKWILGTVTAAALLALAVPQISADAYRGSMQSSLERALGRKVELSAVRVRLFPRPGFTVSNVIIGEDPAVGTEPVAYVTTLRASPRLLALLRGKLEIASVDLEEASLNLTRVDSEQAGVRWNFAGLLRPESLLAFPAIHIHGGRINFKRGDTKSLFYLLDTDIDLWPPDSAHDPWTLKMRANPARTDRSAQGFGSFRVRGEWRPDNSLATLDVTLEKSEFGDLLTLFNGHDTGIQGSITGSAHLAGPLNKVGLSGRVTVSNLHGWAQAPPGGNEWPLLIGGVLNATDQTIDMTATMDVKESPLGLRYRVADLLGRPRWAVTVNASKFPLAPLPGVARNMGLPLPADFRLDGTADGAVSYSAGQVEGGLNLSHATLTVADAPPLRVAGAALRFAQSAIRLEPAEISTEAGETAQLQGVWDITTGRLDAALSSQRMSITAMGKQISVAGIPLLSQATAGVWKGQLRYTSAGTGWAGEVHLRDTVIPFEAFAEPLLIVSADAVIQGNGLAVKRVNMTSGGLQAQGEYQYDPVAPRRHKFRMVMARADGSALEKLFTPALRRGNLFSYAFNFGRPPQPDWLRELRADGTIQAGTIELAGGEFSKFRTRVLWDGLEVRLTNLEAGYGKGSFQGTGAIHLDRRQPAYELAGKVTGMPWRSGTLDADAALTTSGTGAGLLDRLKVTGSFAGREIDLSPVDQYETATGDFEWTWDGRNPRVSLTQLVMKNGAETFQGGAETTGNGQLLLKLTDGTRRIQAAGAIFRGEPFKILP